MIVRAISNRVLNTKDFKHVERSMIFYDLLYSFSFVFLFNLNLNFSFRVSYSSQQLNLLNHIFRLVEYNLIDDEFHS